MKDIVPVFGHHRLAGLWIEKYPLHYQILKIGFSSQHFFVCDIVNFQKLIRNESNFHRKKVSKSYVSFPHFLELDALIFYHMGKMFIFSWMKAGTQNLPNLQSLRTKTENQDSEGERMQRTKLKTTT